MPRQRLLDWRPPEEVRFLCRLMMGGEELELGGMGIGVRRQDSVSEVGGCSNPATSLCQPRSSSLDGLSNAAANLYQPGWLPGSVRTM